MKSGRLLVHARRRAGLTQRQLAERTGIPQPAIARIERQRVSPTFDTMERLLAGTGHQLEVARRIGEGVDRTLIQSARSLTPEQRLLAAGAAGRNLSAFRRATAGGRRREG